MSGGRGSDLDHRPIMAFVDLRAGGGSVGFVLFEGVSRPHLYPLVGARVAGGRPWNAVLPRAGVRVFVARCRCADRDVASAPLVRDLS